MKKIRLLLFLGLFSCKKTQENIIPSECIAEKIAIHPTVNTSLKRVKQYRFENEIVYTFDTGAVFDAPTYILKENCDTLCRIGGYSINPDNCNGESFYNAAELLKIFD